MRLGVTGASGFIGRAFIEVAEGAGHEIVGFSRNPAQFVPGAAEVREFTRPELADFGGLDGLVHLAGEPVFGLWTPEKKRLIFDTRREGTLAVVRGIEKRRPADRPRIFVSASAIGLYGDTGDEVVDEDTDVGFGFLAEVVRAWEAAGRVAADIGLRSVACRIGMVLGPDGGALPVLRRVFRAFLGGRLGSGRQWMSWVHVTDVARILLACVEDAGLSGPVNAVAPHPVTNRDFTATLARLLGRPAVLPAPAFVLRRLPGGMGELFLGSQRVQPAVLRQRGFRWEFPDLEPALRDALGLDLGAPPAGPED